MAVLSDVFTVEEIARAAGVPRDAVEAVVTARSAQPLRGTEFFATTEAIRAGIEARRAIRTQPACTNDPEAHLFEAEDQTTFAARRRGLPSFVSTVIHGTFIASMLWLTSGAPESATTATPRPRLVFLTDPGPGGGGGGGGLRNPLPPRRAEEPSLMQRPRPEPTVSLKKPSEPKPVDPDPLPSRRLVAPVSPAAAAQQQRDGALETRAETTSAGAGTNGGTGTGRGSGDGEGLGAGIGPGSGGGTGGGPYRAGSGVEPPRLLREVKARYTDEARRRGTTGNVLLEIVINRDGTVGDVTVRRGLGAGLDEMAIEAVRQWRFAPARRLGEPVDVIVEVAVEFMLR